MTANEIYIASLSLMPAFESNEELKNQFINAVNILIAENFNIENGLRKFQNKPVLEVPPTVYTLEDRVDMDWRLCKIGLVYGVAGMLYGEEDGGLATGFLNKYEYERSLLMRGEHVEIVDCYGGDS